MATTKTTQRDFFNAIIAVLNGRETAIPTSELIGFVETRIEQLDRKKSKVGGKVAEKRAENESLKAILVDILAPSPLCIADIKKFDDFSGFETSKISALLTQLRNAGIVERTVIKGKPYYQTIQVEEEEASEEEADTE